MRWVIVILLFTLLRSESCKKHGVKLPPCIVEKIEAVQQQPKYNPPATVYRYLYGGSYVYLFTSNCCDQYNYVYDRDCHIVCAPSGGITGKGDGRCLNFNEVATDKTLVWMDER